MYTVYVYTILCCRMAEYDHIDIDASRVEKSINSQMVFYDRNSSSGFWLYASTLLAPSRASARNSLYIVESSFSSCFGCFALYCCAALRLIIIIIITGVALMCLEVIWRAWGHLGEPRRPGGPWESSFIWRRYSARDGVFERPRSLL